jgi:hypothetical protein
MHGRYLCDVFREAVRCLLLAAGHASEGRLFVGHQQAQAEAQHGQAREPLLPYEKTMPKERYRYYTCGQDYDPRNSA